MTIPITTKIMPIIITTVPIGANRGIPRRSIPRIIRSNPVIAKCATILFPSHVVNSDPLFFKVMVCTTDASTGFDEDEVFFHVSCVERE